MCRKSPKRANAAQNLARAHLSSQPRSSCGCSRRALSLSCGYVRRTTGQSAQALHMTPSALQQFPPQCTYFREGMKKNMLPYPVENGLSKRNPLQIYNAPRLVRHGIKPSHHFQFGWLRSLFGGATSPTCLLSPQRPSLACGGLLGERDYSPTGMKNATFPNERQSIIVKSSPSLTLVINAVPQKVVRQCVSVRSGKKLDLSRKRVVFFNFLILNFTKES